MVRLFACAVLGLLLVAANASGADIGYAVSAANKGIIGIKLEGDIVPGDADNLLQFLKKYWWTSDAPPHVEPATLYLASKGGDASEAMKIGRIVRRLRLQVTVPDYDDPMWPLVPIINNRDNCICASACFLVFAGGAYRSGNNIGLHRPYVSRNQNTSDVIYEEQQKKALIDVRRYLEEMEVPTYYIDLMMSRNSQQVYLVTDDDVFNKSHHLSCYTPSIEEFMLRQCQTVSEQEWAAQAAIEEKGTAATPEEERFVQGIWAKFGACNRCEHGEFIKMQNDAFRREFSSSKEGSLLDGLDLSSIPDQPQQEKGVPKGAPGITNDRPAASAPQSRHNPFDDILPPPAQSMGSQPNR
ncbi:MAG: hypothetical protein ACLQDI_02315 [Syntrophobacteraceae bacterium]